MSPSTTTSQVMSTNDLRSHGVETKRDQEHRHKWQHGMKKGPGHSETAHGVPASAMSVVSRVTRKQDMAFGRNKATKHTRAPYIVTDEDNVTPDASSDDESWDPNAPDAEITYSFDNPRGASQGSQILGTALAKAVEKFEGMETDRIVHEEYEVLDREGAEMAKATKAKGKGKMKVTMPMNNATSLISPRDEIEYEFV